MQVLLATDANWLIDDVVAALGDEDTSFVVCTDGREVSKQVTKRTKEGGSFDIAIVDLQIGSMGGIAVTMALRLDASAGNAPDIPILVLLDRVADVFLARRSGANGWLVKPLDPIRLRRAVRAIVAGGTYTEGLTPPSAAEPEDPGEQEVDDSAESASSEVVPAG